MFEINRYTNDSFQLWDDYVPICNNGTLFHLRRFLQYHPDDRFLDHSLIVQKKGKIFAVFPATEERINDKVFLVSHPGSSIGSFVTPEALSIADAISLVQELVSYAKTQRFSGIRINLPPTLYNYRLSNYMDYAYFKHGFKYLKREITSILFLERSIGENLDKFRPSHRRAVRYSSDNGVIIKESDDFKTFYSILTKNLKIRHGVSPTHSLDELLNLHSLFPNRIKLFGAFIDEVMVAGVVNFIVNNNVILAFYISHDEEYQKYRAVNLLFYTIFQWAIEKKYKIYDFGTFTVNEEPNMGLGRFKENFGASGIFRDTIEIKFP